MNPLPRLLRRATPALAAIATVATTFATALVTTAAQAQTGYAQTRAGDLPVTLVYPAAAPAQPMDLGPFRLNVAVDAEPLLGRRPLIVLSHGTASDTTSSHHLAAALAAAGFVVAQPLHVGDNFRDTSLAGPESFRRRPSEISHVIDALASHPAWRERLDLQRVGVYGMSAGGVSALALAGARWRVMSLVRHCQEHAEDDKGFCFNGLTDPTAVAARQARYDAAKGVPDLALPSELTAWHGGRAPQAGDDPRPDPRVAAVAVAVPVAAIFDPASLERIRIPVGVVSASHDTLLVPAYHSSHVLRHCGHCRLLMELQGATHLDVLSPWPASVAAAVGAQQSRGGELGANFDPAQRDEAHRRIAAFFAATLAP